VVHRRVLVVDDLEGPEAPVQDVLVDAPLVEVREQNNAGDHQEIRPADRVEAHDADDAHDEHDEADAGRRGEVPVRAVPPRDLVQGLLADRVAPLFRQTTLGGFLDELLLVEPAALLRFRRRTEARTSVAAIRPACCRAPVVQLRVVVGDHGESGHRLLLRLGSSGSSWGSVSTNTVRSVKTERNPFLRGAAIRSKGRRSMGALPCRLASETASGRLRIAGRRRIVRRDERW
jgi:hypothetical protein